jgi:hypothetical protein
VAEGGGLLNRYTLQRRIEGSNPSVSARTPGFESFLGGDAWKLICVPLQDTAAGLQLARLASRSQEEFDANFGANLRLQQCLSY